MSEQVQNKLNVANKVIASAQTHGPAVAAILAERAKAVEGPDTKASVGAFIAVINAIANLPTAANTTTQDAELAYFAEKADDIPVRAARDAAVTDVAATLGQIRGGLEGTLGAAAVPRYGLSGEIPRTPHKLVAFTRNVLRNLEENPQNVTTALGSSFDTAKAAAVLKTKLDELSGHVGADNREARELEQALTARDRATQAWNDAYQGAATTLEGLYPVKGPAACWIQKRLQESFDRSSVVRIDRAGNVVERSLGRIEPRLVGRLATKRLAPAFPALNGVLLGRVKVVAPRHTVRSTHLRQVLP